MGVVAAIVSAASRGVNAVTRRSLKELSYSVILFGYGLFGTSISIILLFEDYCFTRWGETPRIFSYSKEQYISLTLQAVFFVISTNSSTIALL